MTLVSTPVMRVLALTLALAATPVLAVAQNTGSGTATGTGAATDGKTNPPPEGDTSPPDAQLDTLAAAIAKNGCVVTMANQEQVLADAGMTPLEGANALDWLVRDKRVRTLGVNAFRLEGCK